jgi:hypothetical protein
VLAAKIAKYLRSILIKLGSPPFEPTWLYEDNKATAMHDRLADMFKKFRSWKSSTTLIKALNSGVMAWIEGREIPDVASLHLPNSPMGKLVYKASVEQTSLGVEPTFSRILVHFLASSTGI